MKFLSRSLTISLKFIFFVTFAIGVVTLSVLNTYLSRSYYETHFADALRTFQSKHVERILNEKRDLIPFEISGQAVSEIFSETFTKENMKGIFDIFFGYIENYDGQPITVDLTFLKEKEVEFINKLVDRAIVSPEIQNEAKSYLKKNINLGIPPNIEVETNNPAIDKTLRIIKFILTRKFLVSMIIVTFMGFPLIGIFALNAHPFYMGLKKISLSLIVAGFFISIVEILSGILVKWLSTNEGVNKMFDEASISANPEIIKSVFDFAFGRMLQIITLTGIITLGVGIILYVLSKILQKRYEYSY